MRYRNVARGEPQRRRFISRWAATMAARSPRPRSAAGASCMMPSPCRWTISCSLASPTGRWRRARRKRGQFTGRLVAELERTIEAAGPETIAGFVAEPISFSCGFFPPPAGYFAGVRQVLDRHGILFLDDEVICGYGRTGELFAAGSMGLRPDMMSLAKA